MFVDGKPVRRRGARKLDDEKYILQFSKKDAIAAATWLRALSDGFTNFDADLRKKLPGPVAVNEIEFAEIKPDTRSPRRQRNPALSGCSEAEGKALPDFYLGRTS